MEDFKLPFGEWVEAGVDWIVENAAAPFEAIRNALVFLYEFLNAVLTVPPWWVIIIVVALLAFVARGWLFALGAAVGLLLILGFDQWVSAMDTLALVLVAAIIAVILAVPIGILAATFKPVSLVAKPVMDFLQTMPAFVYLVPALLLFRIGVAPGIVATIIFSLPPGVRLTELGIRGVDKEVVEAGSAFGASRFRILRQIQLPLAMPSIMAGINQVIMLSLSMVVIAGLVGAGGLGEQVVAALQRLDTALGFEAGLSVVILAILLDRFTGSFGLKTGFYSWIKNKLAQRRASRTNTAQPAEAV